MCDIHFSMGWTNNLDHPVFLTVSDDHGWVDHDHYTIPELPELADLIREDRLGGRIGPQGAEVLAMRLEDMRRHYIARSN